MGHPDSRGRGQMWATRRLQLHGELAGGVLVVEFGFGGEGEDEAFEDQAFVWGG